MKLNKIAIAASVLLSMVNASVQASASVAPSGLCKVEKEGGQWKIKSFTAHPNAGAMTYVSNNEAFVTVGAVNGILNAIAEGTTTITATQVASDKADGDTKSCTITIVPAANFTWGSKITHEMSFGDNGNVVKLPKATSTSKGEITYTSSDTDVAEFSKTDSEFVYFTIKSTTVQDDKQVPIKLIARQAANGVYDEMSKEIALTVRKMGGGMTFVPGEGTINKAE